MTRWLLVLLLALWSNPAQAHVKWFSEFSFRDRPLALGEAITPTFLALALLSTVTIGGLVFLDRALAGVPQSHPAEQHQLCGREVDQVSAVGP